MRLRRSLQIKEKRIGEAGSGCEEFNKYTVERINDNEKPKA
jgi:hypothetical protein